MPASPAVPQFSNAAEFKRALAAAMVSVAKENAINVSAARSLTTTLGLPAFTADSTGYTVPEIPADDTIDGRPRAHFTAEIQAQHDVEALKQARRDAYGNLKYLRDSNYITKEQTQRLLEAVGLPTPRVDTKVSYSVSGFGSGEFKVTGEHTAEEIKPKLLPMVKDPVGDAIRETFGADNVRGLSDGVTVSVRTVRTWPELPEEADQA